MKSQQPKADTVNIFVRALVALVALFMGQPSQAADKAHVAVGQIVEHPALDTLRNGLKEGLEGQGFKEGETLTWTYENAQGNPTTAVQIGHKLVSLEPTVIVTLSTPMTQAVAASTSTIPIVFGAVTDPAAAKLTNHTNITGLTDFVSPEKQLELIRSIMPSLKNLGLIFNSGEANSQKQVEAIKALCKQQGIEVVEATVSKTSDVVNATKTLVGKVEAILLPTDNTVITGLESILKVTNPSKIPVFGSDVDIVRRGAFAAYGVDWRDSGLALANMVGALLNKQAIASLPIQNPQNLVLHINGGAAREISIAIPEEVQKKADKVVE
jgi:putative ABC transport system substrate-binding protein